MFNRKIVNVEEALHLIDHYIHLTEAETVSIFNCTDRYLAETIFSSTPLPHFNHSERDGYALRHNDLKGASSEKPIHLKVIETIPAGKIPSMRVEQGQASRIMTGAVIPEGADTVIMFEDTMSTIANNTERIIITREIEKGQHVALIGSEVEEGQTIAEIGEKITPNHIALLSTFGYDQVKVYRKPKVGILSTGSELLRVEESLKPGSIRNSNSYTLYSQLIKAGAQPIFLGIVADDLSAIRKHVLKALQEMDLVVTTGGVAVGDFDIMVSIFEELSGELLFNKVAMRPGTFTTVAAFEQKFLIGLSGNPEACNLGFELFVRRIINGWMNKQNRNLPIIEGFLETNIKRDSNYKRFVRAKIVMKDGMVYIHPLTKADRIKDLKGLDCLLIVPPGSQGLSVGEKVQALKLPS